MSKTSTVEATIRRSAEKLTASSTPLLDARLIVAHVLGCDEAGLILAGPDLIETQSAADIEKLVTRRADGEPIAYILGEKEFFGLSFSMRAPVLCPRPDTETLIEAAQHHFRSVPPQRVLDLGTGSGCLLVSLLTVFPEAIGVGIDKSPHAIRLTADNARRHNVADRMSCVQGDWMKAVRGTFDLIISNPPYIETGARQDLSRDVRVYEDPGALYAGPDGLDDYRRILSGAGSRLAAEGVLILELGYGQRNAIEGIARQIGALDVLRAHSDLAGIDRALVFRASV